MGKMGIHNKITESRYYKIKAETNSPADDKASMEKFGIGASTCRNIRNTKNYSEYMARNYKRGYCTRKDELDKAHRRIDRVENRFVKFILAAKTRISLILAILLATISLLILIIAIVMKG